MTDDLHWRRVWKTREEIKAMFKLCPRCSHEHGDRSYCGAPVETTHEDGFGGPVTVWRCECGLTATEVEE